MTAFIGGQLLPSGFNCMARARTWVSGRLNQSFSRSYVSFTGHPNAV
jgi:hypothetical protein